jgi:hypothetical protein
MIFTEGGRAMGGHAGEVAAGLVPVAQLLGDRAEVERQRQHQRVGVAQVQLARRERLLEHPARLCRVVGLAVQRGQHMLAREQLRVVFAEHRAGGVDRVFQHRAGRGQVTGRAQRVGLAHRGGERGGW